jgi:hypothetical protein
VLEKAGFQFEASCDKSQLKTGTRGYEAVCNIERITRQGIIFRGNVFVSMEKSVEVLK